MMMSGYDFLKSQVLRRWQNFWNQYILSAITGRRQWKIWMLDFVRWLGTSGESFIHDLETPGTTSSAKFMDTEMLQLLEPIFGISVQLLLTVPQTSVTVERPFSSVKRIETRLRSLMTTERLMFLRLTPFEKDLVRTIDRERILTHFKNSKNRRLL